MSSDVSCVADGCWFKYGQIWEIAPAPCTARSGNTLPKLIIFALANAMFQAFLGSSAVLS